MFYICFSCFGYFFLFFPFCLFFLSVFLSGSTRFIIRFRIFAHRRGDVLYGRKRPQEVNPLLTHNASLTLRMCAHGRRKLPGFDCLAHLLLGLDNHVIQKLIDSQKQSVNRNHGQRHINITKNALR